LADSAIAFLQFESGASELSIRTKKERDLDKRLVTAQNKLTEFMD
jgi:hypothetical protein